jgi:hypothetical protein
MSATFITFAHLYPKDRELGEEEFHLLYLRWEEQEYERFVGRPYIAKEE